MQRTVEGERPWNGRRESVVVCGLGTLGARLAELLVTEYDVVILSRGHEERFNRVAALDGVRMVDGDFLRPDALERAGLPHARALLAVSANDFTNLAVALLARELCADLPILVRLAEPLQAAALGRHLPKAAGFSVPGLAAPVFGVAAYRAGHHSAPSLDLARGDVFLIGEHPWLAGSEFIVDGHQSARIPDEHPLTVGDWERQRGAVVIACRPAHNEGPATATESMPPRNRRLAVGDEILLVGPWEAVAARPAGSGEQRRARWGGFPELVRAFFRHVRPAYWAVLAVLIGVIVANTMLFTLTYGLTPLDALYFVVSTLTTVGYGDINLHNAPPALKLYGVLLMLFGVLLIAAVYAVVTDYLIGSRLDDLLGARPVPKRGHVVVCGLGTVGYRTVQMLRSMGESVVAVDSDAAHPYARRARQDGVPVVAGDAVAMETLAQANVDGARCVVAATSDDRTNLAVALAVRDLSPDVAIVLRLFDGALIRPVRVALGIDDALSATEPAAHAFALAARLGPAYRAILSGSGTVPIHIVEVHAPRDVRSGTALESWLREQSMDEPLRVLADRAATAHAGASRSAGGRRRWRPPVEGPTARTVTVATTAAGARALVDATGP